VSSSNKVRENKLCLNSARRLFVNGNKLYYPLRGTKEPNLDDAARCEDLEIVLSTQAIESVW
jgi:hypothetical protein